MPRHKKNGPELSIIIPAAGVGRRMKSHGPKSIIEIGNEYLVNKQIKTIRSQYPQSEIILVVGFQADRVVRHVPPYIKIVENEKFETTNTARSIYMGLRVATFPKVLIIHGDIIFNKETISSIGYSIDSKIIINSLSEMTEDKIGVMVNKSKVVNFSYGNKRKWAQIAFLNKDSSKIFKDIMIEKDRGKLHTFEIFNIMIEKNVDFLFEEPCGMKVVEINSYKDIETAKKI